MIVRKRKPSDLIQVVNVYHKTRIV